MENKKTRRGLFYFIEKFFGLSGIFEKLPSKWIGASFLFFCLCLHYIGMMHYYGRVFRTLHQTQEQVENLKVTYSMIKAEYMQMTKRSEMENKLSSKGLITPSQPPYVIEIHNTK